MKQKSISLLTAFLDSQLKSDIDGFTYQVTPEDEYSGFWNFSVVVWDGSLEIELKLKVDFRDESVWIDMGIDETYEKVEEDRWTVKYFWYRMYCLK